MARFTHLISAGAAALLLAACATSAGQAPTGTPGSAATATGTAMPTPTPTPPPTATPTSDLNAVEQFLSTTNGTHTPEAFTPVTGVVGQAVWYSFSYAAMGGGRHESCHRGRLLRQLHAVRVPVQRPHQLVVRLSPGSQTSAGRAGHSAPLTRRPPVGTRRVGAPSLSRLVDYHRHIREGGV